MGLLTLSALLVIVTSSAISHPNQHPPSRHINVCHFVPTDDEIQALSQRREEGQYGPHGSADYSHEIIEVKKYSPREHILVSIVEDGSPDQARDRYLYTVQAVLPNGKPVGRFKSFDEYMKMRMCGTKEVFLNEQTDVVEHDESNTFLNGGVTFEWVAPIQSMKGKVSIIVTKINMNVLHRHDNQTEESAVETVETTGDED